MDIEKARAVVQGLKEAGIKLSDSLSRVPGANRLGSLPGRGRRP